MIRFGVLDSWEGWLLSNLLGFWDPACLENPSSSHFPTQPTSVYASPHSFHHYSIQSSFSLSHGIINICFFKKKKKNSCLLLLFSHVSLNSPHFLTNSQEEGKELEKVKREKLVSKVFTLKSKFLWQVYIEEGRNEIQKFFTQILSNNHVRHMYCTCFNRSLTKNSNM